MQRRRRTTETPESARTSRSATTGSAAAALVGGDAPLLAHIQVVIESGGQIMIGTIEPIHDAAVAYDGTRTLAMLRRRADESMPALLKRLDAAIATAQATGTRVDEINLPGGICRLRS